MTSLERDSILGQSDILSKPVYDESYYEMSISPVCDWGVRVFKVQWNTAAYGALSGRVTCNLS